MDPYTIAWIIWIFAFGIIETAGLASHRKGSTLSEHVWMWFHVRDRRPTRTTWALRGVLLVGLVWLTLHLGFGWLSL